MTRGIARHVVNAKAPADHVGEQRHQKGHANNHRQRMAAPQHGGDRVHNARIERKLLGGNRGSNADTANNVDCRNGNATSDNRLGDIARWVFHRAGKGRDHFEAHKVEQDDR